MRQKGTTKGAGYIQGEEKTRQKAHTVEEHIRQAVAMVRLEVKRSKRQLDATDTQCVEMVLAQINQDKCTCSDEKYNLEWYEKVTREVIWNYINDVEAERIISRLKSGDQQFAIEFFYGTNPNRCNISRFRSKIIAQIKQTHHVEVSVKEFGNIVYKHLWSYGTWSVLDSYAKKSSFFSWLEQVSRHEVMSELKEMNLIQPNRERTIGNTRLLGKSVEPEVWDCILSDVMPDGLYKDLLVAMYVDRKQEDVIAQTFEMEAETLRKYLEEAKRVLKDKLIRGDGCYEELLLRDKSSPRIEVSNEFVRDFVNWQKENEAVSSFGDIFGTNLSQKEVDEKVIDFLYHFSDQLQWTDADKMIWQLRYIENVAPVELAAQLGKTRAWLDVRYSHLQSKFKRAIQTWWQKHT